MVDKIDILSKVDEGLVGVVKNFERDSGYVGKVLERVGADLSEISNVTFDGDLSLSEEAGFLRCKSVAQEIMNYYTTERRRIVSSLNGFSYEGEISEEESVVLGDVHKVLGSRMHLLGMVYDAVRPSDSELFCS